MRWSLALGPLVRGTELGLEILDPLGLLPLGPQFLHLHNGKAERGGSFLGLWKQEMPGELGRS